MPSPFPGMDSYLEQPALWSSFHSRLIVAVANAVEENLPPQYYVEVETRTYQDNGAEGLLIGIPNVSVVSEKPALYEPASSGVSVQIRPQQVTIPMPITVKERYLEVRDISTHQVITAIELLSPKNKRKGEGRSRYLKKRLDILGSASHFVELDLLRAGQPMPILNGQTISPYRILVSRSSQRPLADLYSIELQQPLPDLPIPLKAEQEVVTVPLQAVFSDVYSKARYANRIDYAQPAPPPSLSKDEQQWLSQLKIKAD